MNRSHGCSVFTNTFKHCKNITIPNWTHRVNIKILGCSLLHWDKAKSNITRGYWRKHRRLSSVVITTPCAAIHLCVLIWIALFKMNESEPHWPTCVNVVSFECECNDPADAMVCVKTPLTCWVTEKTIGASVLTRAPGGLGPQRSLLGSRCVSVDTCLGSVCSAEMGIDALISRLHARKPGRWAH